MRSAGGGRADCGRDTTVGWSGSRSGMSRTSGFGSTGTQAPSEVWISIQACRSRLWNTTVPSSESAPVSALGGIRGIRRGEVSDHHAGREADLPGHQGRGDRVLLAVAEHRASGRELVQSVERVTGAARRLVADAVAHEPVALESVDHVAEPLARLLRCGCPQVEELRQPARQVGCGGEHAGAGAELGERLGPHGGHRSRRIAIALGEPRPDRPGSGDVVVEEAVGEEFRAWSREGDALELPDARHPHVGVAEHLHLDLGLLAVDVRLVEAIRHAGESSGLRRAVGPADGVHDPVVGVEGRDPQPAPRRQAPHRQHLDVGDVGLERRTEAGEGLCCARGSNGGWTSARTTLRAGVGRATDAAAEPISATATIADAPRTRRASASAASTGRPLVMARRLAMATRTSQATAVMRKTRPVSTARAACTTPRAIPVRSRMAGGMMAAAGLRLRSAMVTAHVEATRPSRKGGTSSAWYEPTGTAIVTSCFHERAAPATSSTRPCGLGITPPMARLGTATGTPSSR